MTDIHVALVAPWQRRGGVATYTERLLSELVETGVEVAVVPIENTESQNPLAFVDLYDEIPRSADVVHVQYEAGLFGKLGMSGVGAPAFFIALARLDTPVVVTAHEVHSEHPHRGPIGDRLLRLRDAVIERLAFRAADMTVVHTSRAEDVLKARHGDDRRITRMVHPADAEANPIPTDKAKLELDIEGPVALTFGFVEEKKRYRDVISVLPEFPDLTYLIAGGLREGEGEAVLERVREQARELDVGDQINHFGYVDESDVSLVFSAADVVVLPYERVSQSGVVNDALAYGRPVIASDLPAFRELEREFGCVRLYNSESLESVLADVLEKSEERARLEAAAAEYCGEVNWSEFAKETAALYADLANESSL